MHIYKDDRPLIIAMVCLVAVWVCNCLSDSMLWGHPVTVMYASLCVVWTLTIQKRIIQKNLRIFLELVGLILMLLFCEQIARYDYFAGLENIRRFLWYSYYIPLILIPLFSFWAALCIGREAGDRPLRFWKWIVFVSIFLIAAILTNDLHQLAFHLVFSDWNESYTYGALYYATVLCIVAEMAAAFVITLHRCRLYRSRHAAWIPALFLIGGLFLFLLMFLNGGSTLFYRGRNLFQFQDIYCLMLIGFWESCIRTGLISSNRDYERLFDVSSLRAQIADDTGTVIHQAAGAETLTRRQMQQADAGAKMPGHDLRLQSQSIHGGHVYWVDDLTAINRINEELADTAEQLDQENMLLERGNELYEQKLRYETQNRMYDEIARKLQPQLAEIERLIGKDGEVNGSAVKDGETNGSGMKDGEVNGSAVKDGETNGSGMKDGEVNGSAVKDGETNGSAVKVGGMKSGEAGDDFRERLARVVVLGAYIKRRANLYLIAEQRKSISLGDLLLSIRESLEYVKLSGIPCGAIMEEDGETAAWKVLLLYDFFEQVLEAALPAAEAVMVSLWGGKREELLVELSLPAGLPEPEVHIQGAELQGGVLKSEREEESCFISLRFGPQGEVTGA